MSGWTIQKVRDANRRAGGHFFDRETLRGFHETIRDFQLDYDPVTDRIYVMRKRDGKRWAFDEASGRIGASVARNPAGSQKRFFVWNDKGLEKHLDVYNFSGPYPKRPGLHYKVLDRKTLVPATIDGRRTKIYKPVTGYLEYLEAREIAEQLNSGGGVFHKKGGLYTSARGFQTTRNPTSLANEHIVRQDDGSYKLWSPQSRRFLSKRKYATKEEAQKELVKIYLKGGRFAYVGTDGVRVVYPSSALVRKTKAWIANPRRRYRGNPSLFTRLHEAARKRLKRRYGAKKFKSMMTRHRGGRMRPCSNPRRYELFYGTGGHGGPYRTIAEARKRAKELLAGNRNERFIEIRAGDFKTIVGVVKKPSRCSACGRNPPFPHMDAESRAANKRLLSMIRPGDKVTIMVHAGGIGKHMEWKETTGRAVMRGPAGWVLNMGGRYGTPGIADEENIVRVRRTGKNPRKRMYAGKHRKRGRK